MVGYQGESSRSVIHRQSQTDGRTIQTGTPRAPARWAGELSAEITRSRFSITAAVSARSSTWRPRSVTSKPAGSLSSWSRPKFFWRLKSRTPGTRATGSSWASRNERSRSLLCAGIALPDDPDLQLVDAFELGPPAFHAGGLGGEVGDLGRDGLEASCPGSAPGSSREHGSRTPAANPAR